MWWFLFGSGLLFLGPSRCWGAEPTLDEYGAIDTSKALTYDNLAERTSVEVLRVVLKKERLTAAQMAETLKKQMYAISPMEWHSRGVIEPVLRIDERAKIDVEEKFKAMSEGVDNGIYFEPMITLYQAAYMRLIAEALKSYYTRLVDIRKRNPNLVLSDDEWIPAGTIATIADTLGDSRLPYLAAYPASYTEKLEFADNPEDFEVEQQGDDGEAEVPPVDKRDARGTFRLTLKLLYSCPRRKDPKAPPVTVGALPQKREIEKFAFPTVKAIEYYAQRFLVAQCLRFNEPDDTLRTVLANVRLYLEAMREKKPLDFAPLIKDLQMSADTDERIAELKESPWAYGVLLSMTREGAEVKADDVQKSSRLINTGICLIHQIKRQDGNIDKICSALTQSKFMPYGYQLAQKLESENGYCRALQPQAQVGGQPVSGGQVETDGEPETGGEFETDGQFETNGQSETGDDQGDRGDRGDQEQGQRREGQPECDDVDKALQEASDALQALQGSPLEMVTKALKGLAKAKRVSSAKPNCWTEELKDKMDRIARECFGIIDAYINVCMKKPEQDKTDCREAARVVVKLWDEVVPNSSFAFSKEQRLWLEGRPEKSPGCLRLEESASKVDTIVQGLDNDDAIVDNTEKLIEAIDDLIKAIDEHQDANEAEDPCRIEDFNKKVKETTNALRDRLMRMANMSGEVTSEAKPDKKNEEILRQAVLIYHKWKPQGEDALPRRLRDWLAELTMMEIKRMSDSIGGSSLRILSEIKAMSEKICLIASKVDEYAVLAKDEGELNDALGKVATAANTVEFTTDNLSDVDNESVRAEFLSIASGQGLMACENLKTPGTRVWKAWTGRVREFLKQWESEDVTKDGINKLIRKLKIVDIYSDSATGSHGSLKRISELTSLLDKTLANLDLEPKLAVSSGVPSADKNQAELVANVLAWKGEINLILDEKIEVVKKKLELKNGEREWWVEYIKGHLQDYQPRLGFRTQQIWYEKLRKALMPKGEFDEAEKIVQNVLERVWDLERMSSGPKDITTEIKDSVKKVHTGQLPEFVDDVIQRLVRHPLRPSDMSSSTWDSIQPLFQETNTAFLLRMDEVVQKKIDTLIQLLDPASDTQPHAVDNAGEEVVLKAARELMVNATILESQLYAPNNAIQKNDRFDLNFVIPAKLRDLAEYQSAVPLELENAARELLKLLQHFREHNEQPLRPIISALEDRLVSSKDLRLAMRSAKKLPENLPPEEVKKRAEKLADELLRLTEHNKKYPSILEARRLGEEMGTLGAP